MAGASRDDEVCEMRFVVEQDGRGVEGVSKKAMETQERGRGRGGGEVVGDMGRRIYEQSQSRD